MLSTSTAPHSGEVDDIQRYNVLVAGEDEADVALNFIRGSKLVPEDIANIVRICHRTSKGEWSGKVLLEFPELCAQQNISGPSFAINSEPNRL